jgi:DNA polymerase III alpha subunit
VLDYVRTTYGEERVALVATISTMRPKSALRETAKAYGLDDAASARLLRTVLDSRHPDPRRRRLGKVEDLIRQLDDPHLKEVAREGYALVGQPHHLSIHPGGVVITPGPLTDVVPVQWVPKGFLITQFDHIELVRRHHDPDFQLTAIPAEDPATSDLLRTGATVGVFQCESTGAQRTLRQLNARNVTDLAIANAFFKPGPATGGMAASFVRRYRDEEVTTFLHPALEPVLGATKGVLIFQEQILRVAREIAGLTWEEADHLRRGMSRFQADEMETMHERFVQGCCRSQPGFSPQQAETLWEQVVAFAGYGFNQGHATAYAAVSYRSAYLKCHWPAEFLCARLADRGGFHHPAIYMAEAVRLGIDVRPPHVNHSLRRFSLDRSQGDPILWMGLGQVRDLRRVAVAAIIARRRERPFHDLRDLLLRLSLQPKEIAHLIECGALDGLGSSRAALLAELAEFRRSGSAMQLGFDLGLSPAEEERAGRRLIWERQLLGQSISVHPLMLIDPPFSSLQTLDEAAQEAGPVQVAVVRLPGWTGGQGYFVGDRRTYVVAKPAAHLARPPVWQPMRVRAHWRRDEWGSRWLAVERWEALSTQADMSD